MRSSGCAFILSLAILQEIAQASGHIYQWSDDQGQIHFGDTAPAAARAELITLDSDPNAGKIIQGLRPGERAILDTIERSKEQRQVRSRTERARINEQRQSQRNRCRQHRKKMKLAQGRDDFKQHARYLRDHCW